MEIVFVRHGEPNYETDTLTEQGQAQAKALGEYFKNQQFEKVYSSPLGRAYQTALACFPKEVVEVKPWLKEFNHYVDLRDGTKQLNWDFYPAYLSQHDDLYNPATYLDTADLQSDNVKRDYLAVVSQFDEILASFGYVRQEKYYRAVSSHRKRIVFFCHLGIMSVLVSHLTNIPYLVLAQHFCPTPSSFSTFITEERQQGIAQFRCLRYGAIPHLELTNQKPTFAGRFCEIFDCDDRH